MRAWVVLVGLAVMALTGCAMTRYVDAKGRDCVRHLVYPLFPVMWDTCEAESTPLAAQRIQVDQKADVTATIQQAGKQ